MNPEQSEPITSVQLPAIPRRPVSKCGDIMHEMCVPILDYLTEHGDEEAQAKALKARAYWEQEQAWVIDWATRSRYFVLAEHACRDLRGFKLAIADTPYQDDASTMLLQIALDCGERYNRPKGIGRKRVVGKWKRKRGK